MRLTLLIRDLGYGGAQRQLVALATALPARGVRATVITFYGGAHEMTLREAGIEVVCLGKQHRWDMLGFVWRLVLALRASQPDVLYSYLTESNVMAALLRPSARSARTSRWRSVSASTALRP